MFSWREQRDSCHLYTIKMYLILACVFVCVWMSPSPPLQSKTTASPATTSYIRLMARGAPRCWWSTLPPGGSAARSTCLWRRPSYSESTGLLLTGEHHANLWCVMNVRQGRSQDIITVVARSGQSGQPLTRGGPWPPCGYTPDVRLLSHVEPIQWPCPFANDFNFFCDFKL